MNGTTIFVKDYSASLRMHVETPNTLVSPYHQQLLRIAVPRIVFYEFL